MAALQQNQLLFNLDMPTMPVNIVTTFHHPEAIVIEKFGCMSSSGPIITAPKPAFQFSAVSEESLSNAVQLARRDLKKQKEESFTGSQQKKSKVIGKNTTKTGRTQVIHSQEYKERLRRREDRKKQQKNHEILLKERERGWKVRTAKTQTGSHTQLNNRIPNRRTIPDMPPMSMSPPTRDVGPDLTQVSGDSRTLAEIRRLREDMDICLNKIHEIHEAAKKNPSAWRQDSLIYAEDIESEKKRVIRSEEQATRSARTIYQLTQQVRFIQDEINCIGPVNIKHHKKQSQMLSRLAAVHRGAVRSLQSFIQHLPDCDLSEGLPRSYHELALLLRQLSLCCAQLEVAGETGVPDSVMTLLKDYAEMNKVLDQHSSPKSPPRHCERAKQENVKKSPVSRKLQFGAGVEPKRIGQRSEVTVGANTRHPGRGPSTIDKVVSQTVDRAVDATPERQTSLRAGIAALVRAADNPRSSRRRQRSPVPPLDLPVTPRTPRGVAWEYPLEKPKLQQFRAGHKKGLLLPAKLREKRKKMQKSRTVLPLETHYSEPTLASRLKEVPPEEKLPNHSPPRSPQLARSKAERRPRSSSLPGAPVTLGRPRSPSPYGTPRSLHSPSPYGTPRSLHSPSPYGTPRSLHSPSPYGTPRSPGRMHSTSPFGTPRTSSPNGRQRSPYGTPRSPGHKDIIRQVQLDRENALRRNEKAKIGGLRHELGQPGERVSRAEQQIKEKLQPLLDQAQDILEAFQSLQLGNSQPSHVLPVDREDHVHNFEVNADLLADSLLGELLEDTAREVGHLDSDTQVECKAAFMQDAPSMETMLQRLQDMESEQQDIRRRWATLVYEEENTDIPSRARYFDVPLSEQPGTPTPIHVTSQLPDIHQTLLPDSVLARLESNPSDQGAILFTKPMPQPTHKSSLHLSQLDGALHIQPEKVQPRPGILTVLSQEVVDSIESHKKEFEQYLKQNSYQSVGRFNPWVIVEEVASEILDDCLRDVSKELEDINNDVVSQVYSREFSKVPILDPKPSVVAVSSLQAGTSYTSGQTGQFYTHKSEHPNGFSHHLSQSTQQPKLVESKYEGKQLSEEKSQEEAASRSAQSPSPDPVSGNYSYDDDFAESSPRGKTADDVSNRSDYSQDSWKTD